MFNTLLYTKKLEAVGIKRDIAEAHIQILAEVVEKDMATKQDLRELEYRLTIRIAAINGAMITLAIAITAALAKVF